MSLDLCLPVSFFFFKPQFIGHSARIQYYRGAGVLAGAPSSSTGQRPVWDGPGPNHWTFGPWPLLGSGGWAPVVRSPLSSFSSSDLAEEGFSKPNLVSKKCTFVGREGGSIWERVCMCVCVCKCVDFFIIFLKCSTLCICLSWGYSCFRFFSAVLEHLKLQERNSLNVILLTKQAWLL